MATTVNVTVLATDQNNNAVSSARVTCKLSHADVDSTYGYILPEEKEGTTDASGEVVFALWPNELGSAESYYVFKIENPDTGKIQRINATIPNTDCNLHAVADLPTYDGATVVTAPLNANLASIASLTTAADKVLYFSDENTAALATFTAAGRALIDDANAAAQRTTLELGNVDNTSDADKPISTATQAALDDKQPLDAELTAIAGLTSAADRAPYFTGLGAAALAVFTSAARTFTAAVDAAAQRVAIGLGNVDNTSDADKPVSTAQAAADAAVLSSAQSYADGLVVGLIDDRGNYDASVNTFPASGGSGSAGAIKKGDLWTISVAGTLGGHAVTAGDVIRALVDTPGQTDSNWAITENNFGYVAENSANKDASGGYAGLTLFKINFRNALNTITSFFTNANTVQRTYTFQDRDGTIADLEQFSASTGSSLSGHIATGTGASATTAQAKLRRIYTEGDHSTNQQTAIAAIGKPYMVPSAAAVTLTVGTDVATLAAAFAAIAGWAIPEDATVTIALPSGAATSSSAASFAHPHGHRVEVLGPTPVTASATAISVTGSSGAYSVQYTVASSSGVAVGDYAIVSAAAGTGEFRLLNGMGRVSAVAAGSITITNTAKNAAWPTMTMSGATITVLKAVLTFTGVDGVRVDGPLGYIDQCAIVGDKTAGTIGLLATRAETGYKNFGRVTCGPAFGVQGFGDANVMASMNGVVDARYIATSDAVMFGLFAQHGGSIMASNCLVLGCGQSGIYAHSNGDVWAEDGSSCGNTLYGAWTLPGGSILMQSGFVWSNVSDGLRASWGGQIRAPSISARYNGSHGVFAHENGTAVLTSATLTNNTGSGAYAQGSGCVDVTSVTSSSNGAYGVYCDGGFVVAASITASSNTSNGIAATNGGVILGNALTGSGNGTYLVSATNGAFVRATNASAAGQTMFASNGGRIDATSATGSPTLTKSHGGIIIDTSGTYTNNLGTKVTVNGATETTVLNSAKDSAYNSEASSSICLQNVTDPLKMLVAGYDNTRDFGFIQALKSTSGYKNLALNPNAGNVGIGLGATAPTARLHLPAGAAGAGNAPLKFTSGTNLTTAEAGALEYNGTNLFFTRSGTTREGVLTQSAVTTEALTSDTSITVNIGGVSYKLLAKA